MFQMLNHVNVFLYEALYSVGHYLAAKMLMWVIQPKNKSHKIPNKNLNSISLNQ